jgi:hypothetical protein
LQYCCVGSPVAAKAFDQFLRIRVLSLQHLRQFIHYVFVTQKIGKAAFTYSFSKSVSGCATSGKLASIAYVAVFAQRSMAWRLLEYRKA